MFRRSNRSAAARCGAEPLERRLLFAAGDFDPTFGGRDGAVSTLPVFPVGLAATAVAPGGKVVAVSESGLILARYNADGGLDPTFGGGDGLSVVSRQLDNVRGAAAAVLPDNRILVAGSARGDFLLMRFSPDGDLDPAFGPGGVDGDGVITTDFGGTFDFATCMAVQPDGKIVLGGSARGSDNLYEGGDFALARYNPDGTLDATFAPGGDDGDGRVSVDFATGSGKDPARDVALLPGGKIVLVGTAGTYSSSPSEAIGVAVFNADGSLDASFSPGGAEGDGRVVTRDAAFPAGAEGYSVAVDAAGRVVVGASLQKLIVSERDSFTAGRAAFVRYNADGSLDATFGGTGIVTPQGLPGAYGPVAVLVAALPANEVVGAVSGFSTELARLKADGSTDMAFGGGDGIATPPGTTDHGTPARSLHVLPGGKLLIGASEDLHRFFLARLNPDGSADTSFDPGDGEARVEFDDAQVFGGGTGAPAIAAASDDTVVVAASHRPRDATQSFATLVRYTRDGLLDPTFGPGGADGDGVATDDASEGWLGIAVAPDGKIVTFGQFLLVRYNADGTRDSSFGDGGSVAAPPGVSFAAVAIMPDGRVVVAGSQRFEDTGESQFFVVRYASDGTPDPTFGGGDGIATAMLDPYSYAAALALLPDGRITVAGATSTLGTFETSAALARFKPDGSPDETFGGDGTVITDLVPGGFDQLYDLALYADGSLVAAAGSLVRYRADGSLDLTFGQNGVAHFSVTNIDPESSSHPQLVTADSAYRLALQSDGKIVAAATAKAGQSDYRTAVVRFAPGGQVDTTFNGGLKLDDPAPAETRARDVAVQPGTGRILFGSGVRWALQGEPPVAPVPPGLPPPPPPPDLTPPTAWAVSLPAVIEAGADSTLFAVRYDDETGLDRSTFDGNDILVTAPDGTTALAEFNRIEPPTDDPKVLAVSYRYTRPGGGAFTPADFGWYTLTMQPDQVRDLGGNAVPAGAVRDGRFLVDVPGGEANLHCVSVALPARTVVAGARRAVVRVWMSNVDTAPIDSAADVALFASPNFAPDATDLPLATVRRRIRLRPGQDRWVRIGVPKFMAGVPAGDYYLVARLDAGNVIPEKSKWDNSASSSDALHVISRPARARKGAAGAALPPPPAAPSPDAGAAHPAIKTLSARYEVLLSERQVLYGP